MRKLLIIFIFFLLTFSLSGKPDSGEAKTAGNLNHGTVPDVEITSSKLDKEAQILVDYLARYDSPLKYHAQDFVDAAKQYGLDWKMLPAIAGVESTFGNHIPGGYNAWGWGVYGPQALYFKSWKEAIYTISQGLRENYINKGYNEPFSMNRIYAASPAWGSNVTYFMNDLEKFASQHKPQRKELPRPKTTPEIAAVSGQLVLQIGIIP